LHRRFITLTQVKDLKLPKDPEIKATITPTGKGQVELKLSTNKLAKNVYLSFAGTQGFFSDNYFDLLPGNEVSITFTASGAAQALNAETLRIRTVADTY
jgi:beta-mannosidase